MEQRENGLYTGYIGQSKVRVCNMRSENKFAEFNILGKKNKKNYNWPAQKLWHSLYFMFYNYPTY